MPVSVSTTFLLRTGGKHGILEKTGQLLQGKWETDRSGREVEILYRRMDMTNRDDKEFQEQVARVKRIKWIIMGIAVLAVVIAVIVQM